MIQYYYLPIFIKRNIFDLETWMKSLTSWPAGSWPKLGWNPGMKVVNILAGRILAETLSESWDESSQYLGRNPGMKVVDIFPTWPL